MSHLDISGVNDPESIPRGQRICLYPKFDPQDENDPVKADIGLVILEEPLYGEEIPISQSSNISLKSCSKCQYRSCEVYEYQMDTPEQTFDKIMADIIKQWSPSVDDEVEPVHSHDASTTDEAWTGNAPNLEDYTNVKVMQNGSQNQYTTQANLTPNISLSDKVIPWGIFTPGAAVNKTVVPIEALISNKTFDFSLSEGARIPQPSGTVEPWSSLSNSIANSQDQPIIDSVRPQNHPVSHAGRLQIVPMINLGAPSTSKVVITPSMPNDLESKNVPNQLPYSTPPTQGQSSFKGVIQPTAEINHN
ncbi:hypothetical protein I79_022818 [Cricetulus griseus]|uniref:Uncharacterized protein n=1 Tax=Cricetulus griseus TaxID=10029 RepID=G3IGD4_CRIGR|nr:hypothetical protein I79_022818 [Cricetulus griseus]